MPALQVQIESPKLARLSRKNLSRFSKTNRLTVQITICLLVRWGLEVIASQKKGFRCGNENAQKSVYSYLIISHTSALAIFWSSINYPKQRLQKSLAKCITLTSDVTCANHHDQGDQIWLFLKVLGKKWLLWLYWKMSQFM